MRVQTTEILASWQVAERTGAGEADWIPALVPGHVHLDLVRAGVIGDPFYRMQERGCRWVDEADWTYRTTFTVDAERLASRGAHGRHFLRFGGLDTIARVFLNDNLVGSAENFFVSHRFDVTEALRAGDNDLRVEFDSALRVGRERASAYVGDGTSERGASSYFNFGPRAFVRKAQYMFGWDWGPELVSCGIWQKVELITVPVAEITDWRYDTTFTGENAVHVTVTAAVERYDPDAPLALDLFLRHRLRTPGVFPIGMAIEGQAAQPPIRAAIPAGAGRHVVEAAFSIADVARWQSNGAPEGAALYEMFLRVLSDEQVVESRHWRYGFRTVELVREPDADGGGEGFKLRVNGIDTFIKGANWIPMDSFPARKRLRHFEDGAAPIDSRLHRLLREVRDAGFNMLRVWGGGLYESEEFYDLCDRYGILVWQDFPFACSSYPDDERWFVNQVRAEATAAVRRIRNHPSLALWCGGNENVELHQDRWAGKTQATRFFGDRLIHETLPAVLAAEDPQTPYWPNSPYGGPKATSEDYGDSHYWNVWHSKLPGSNGDWGNYAQSESRFSSEFGFAAPCGPAAWEEAAAPEDRWVRSPVARWHDKTRKGYETYLGFIALHFPEPQTFDDLIYYGQANQAEALKFGIEHWRRRKGRCWGTLFWQLNDCWPVQSWSVIDSAGEPKAAYYAAKRFYAPLLLSLTRSGTLTEAHLTNDTLADAPGRVTLRALTFNGEERARRDEDAVAPANAASGPVAQLTLPDDGFVHAAFTGADGAVLAENFLLLAEPKDLRLPDPGLAVEIAVGRHDREAILTVSARRFAGSVWLRFAGLREIPVFSDNWFHLAPGQTRAITVTNLPAGMSADELRARLRIRHL